MKAFLALLRVQLKGMLSSSLNMGQSKKKVVSSTLALVFLVGIGAFLSVTYSLTYGILFKMQGRLDLMLSFMGVVALAMTLMLTIQSVQSHVYSTKDLDIVLSLPVTPLAVVVSRILALYIEILLIITSFLLPSGIIFLVLGGSGGIFLVFRLFLGGALLGFLVTSLGLLVGSVLTLVVSRLRHKNLVLSVLGMLSLLAIIGLSIMSSSGANNVDVATYDSAFSTYIPFVVWLAKFAVSGNLLALLGLFLVGPLPFFLLAWVISFSFKGLLTRLASSAQKQNYKLRSADMGSGGAIQALLKKEARRFFGTPIYLMNTGFGLVITIIGSIVALFQKSKILDFFALFQASGFDMPPLMPLIVLGCISGMTTMVLPSSCAISLEGKSIWVLKTSPLSHRSIFIAKAGLSFVLCAGTMIISGVLLSIAFELAVLHTILMLVFAVLLAAFMSTLYLYINLLLPRMDTPSDVVAVKQGPSTLVSLLAAWLMMGILIALAVFMTISGVGFIGIALAGIALLAVLSFGLFVLMDKHGSRLFVALS